MSAADRIAETILELARIQGEGTRQSGLIRAQAVDRAAQFASTAQANTGQLWGQTIADLGKTFAAIPQQRQQARVQQQETDLRQQEMDIRRQQLQGAQRQQDDANAIDKAMQAGIVQQADGTFAPDRQAISSWLTQNGKGHLLPAMQEQWTKNDDASMKRRELQQKLSEAEADDIGSVAAQGLAVLKGGGSGEDAAGAMLPTINAHGANGVLDRTTHQRLVQELDTLKSDPDKLAATLTRWQNTSKAQREIQTQQVGARKALADASIAEANAARGGLTADQVAQQTNRDADNQRADTALERSQAAQAEAARHNRAMEARPVGGATGPQSQDDVKEAVAGMIDGTIPPQLPGRNTKEYNATIAEAHRRGFDLVRAVTDWNATQKHIATLNGAQQTRLNQAVNQLPDLLDSVEDLAKQWKGGRFPILNRANLAAAKNGIYGEQVASIARQLDQQIADVTGDLGAVYMGGNSPTDQSLKLAQTALGSDWSQKVLLDMVKLARKNVQIRHNSIVTTGVQGASANNPYAPPTTPAPQNATPAAPQGRQRVIGPNGERGSVPAGTSLPSGWKLE